jgi:hypothetical protein
MARALRIEFSGALYHVTSRGNGRAAIYWHDADRQAFLEVIGQAVERFNWMVHAYYLMDNHYHVVLNPVRSGMVERAQDWPWSSYRAMAGAVEAPRCLHAEWLLSIFSSNSRDARQCYEAFVAQGENQPSPWADIKSQIYLGSENFVAEMQAQRHGNKDSSEVPVRQRRAPAKPLSYFENRYAGNRNTAIVQAYATGGYTMRAIADYFGLHYSYISRIIARAETAT